MDYPILVFCPACNQEFPITQQNEWSGLCPECQFEATENYISAQKYLNDDEKVEEI